jgi:hypothetical protein
MKKYMVKVIEDCPLCLGKKVELNPNWQEFYYWVEYNYPNHEDPYDLVDEYFGDDPPDEMITCWECNGIGTVTYEVSLREALAELEHDED